MGAMEDRSFNSERFGHVFPRPPPPTISCTHFRALGVSHIVDWVCSVGQSKQRCRKLKFHYYYTQDDAEERRTGIKTWPCLSQQQLRRRRRWEPGVPGMGSIDIQPAADHAWVLDCT